MKLSGIVIAKNSEYIIQACLESISFCDEVIVVDAGSTDQTVSVAKKLGAKIITGDENSFAKQRELGLKAASGEWVLYIDTDERVSANLRENILEQVRKENNEFAGFRIQRKNYYLGNYQWPKVELLERLFKKSELHGWYGQLHETPKVEGKIGVLSGSLSHYTHQDLTSMLAKTIRWSDIEGDLRLSAHHPKMVWWRFFRVMITAFFDSYVKQGGWQVGTPGLIESIYQSYSMFITYAKLWELQQKN